MKVHTNEHINIQKNMKINIQKNMKINIHRNINFNMHIKMKINIHMNIHMNIHINININHPTHTQVFLPVLETCLLRLMLQALHNTGIWQVGNVCTRLRMMIIRYSRSTIIKVNCTFMLCYFKNKWWNIYRNKDVLNKCFSVFLLNTTSLYFFSYFFL